MNQEDEGAARRLGFPVDPPGGTVKTESERRCVQDDLRGGTHPCRGDRFARYTIRRIAALAEANRGGLWDESLNLYPQFGGTPRLRAHEWHWRGAGKKRFYGIGVMVPNKPSVSPLGPAVKYSVLGLEFLPPSRVSVHNPSITSQQVGSDRLGRTAARWKVRRQCPKRGEIEIGRQHPQRWRLLRSVGGGSEMA
jgi:hypothetical protein